MKNFIIMLFVGSVVALGGFAGYAAEKASDKLFVAGNVWVNELGSTMTITGSGYGGSFTGTYVTNAGCGRGKPRPLVGWSNGGAVTFTVNFQECNSLTSWSGNMTSSGQLFTLWQLTVSGVSQWNSIIAGSDTFMPR